MSLQQQLVEYVRACFTAIWIETHEQHEALAAISQLCQQEQWQLAAWNIDEGLRVGGMPVESTGGDPLAAIRSAPGLASPEGTALLVLENFHRFLASAEIMQSLMQQILAGKQSRTIVVILAPVVQLPVELEKLFIVLEHELPDREQLREIAQEIATEESELPEGAELEIVLDAAAGLTRLEAENAFSLSLVRQGRITSEAVWELKSGMLKKSGLLELHRGAEDFGSQSAPTARQLSDQQSANKSPADSQAVDHREGRTRLARAEREVSVQAERGSAETDRATTPERGSGIGRPGEAAPECTVRSGNGSIGAGVGRKAGKSHAG